MEIPDYMALKQIFFKSLILCGLCLSGVHAVAQSRVFRQSLIWTRYYAKVRVGSRGVFHSEYDNRIFLSPSVRQHQFITHQHYHYVHNPAMESWIGASYSVVSSQKPENQVQLHVPEWRLWQAFSYKHVLSRGALQHRLRWEERFIHQNNGTNLTPGSRFVFRLRYAAGIQWPVTKHLDLKMGEEVMVQFGEGVTQAFDQNRLWAGVDYSFRKPDLHLELLYMWLWQQGSATTMYNRDILRLTLSQFIQVSQKAVFPE
ncbi:MAG TPA: DUF2490 domain-containing protein [Saprospiraceae bacterium]|nr:DUF2490 domain-containing protein [Saprospiraceae bacterium]